MQQKPRKQSRFIRAHEIFKLAPGLTPNQWYSLVARGRVPGVERREDGWGYLVPRKAFMRWLGSHPQFQSAPAAEIPQHNSLSDESSPKEKSDERSSVRACPA